MYVVCNLYVFFTRKCSDLSACNLLRETLILVYTKNIYCIDDKQSKKRNLEMGIMSNSAYLTSHLTRAYNTTYSMCSIQAMHAL